VNSNYNATSENATAVVLGTTYSVPKYSILATCVCFWKPETMRVRAARTIH